MSDENNDDLGNLRLIRRVQGPIGSLRLYRHARVGLAEVVEVQKGESQVFELRRHPDDTLPELLAFADEVQRGVDADKVLTPKAAKRRKGGEPADSAFKPRGKTGGGS
jgi:hypothetical protein